ncbi:hypothetical protein [Oceanobacillus sp. J11TS1]|uniref:hypothetical protein n=1 Tax=Oceanobacillus sp. J11TS1 TaxID=2807191 RepID=UPI001B218017|nr:hypothetical protein [Oceanobacillus sp. J11TS1]GIO25295.1 hypothetical protein J11TS1_38760 [Oceanobacillus sp. J11TS1]
MRITSLEDKRKQKAMKETVKLPIYESIHRNEEGELIGKLVDYAEVPRWYIEK